MGSQLESAASFRGYLASVEDLSRTSSPISSGGVHESVFESPPVILTAVHKSWDGISEDEMLHCDYNIKWSISLCLSVA